MTGLNYRVLMLPTITKDTGVDNRTIKGIIATPRYPIDRAMLSTKTQITTKHPMTQLMILHVAIYYQHTIHH